MTRIPLCTAITAIVAAPSAHGAIVYSARQANPAGVLLINEPDERSSFFEVSGSGREVDCRVGDAVTLAGTDRFVTEFSTRLWSFQSPASPVTLDVELTLYHLSGGVPGAPIWSGTRTGVVLPTTSAVEVVFNPGVTVPDSLCFAIAFTNIVGTRQFGVVAAQFASVGSSPLHTLFQSTATQEWRQDVGLNPGSDVFDHVDARITAVPAPGAIAASALLLIPRRRRRHTSAGALLASATR
ncbi:MAG TPA: hypothetical protein VD997_10430 [Phycisphaerales bacterium]|nr:hypothetical protein [Phycisphaerales bacterium]